VRNSLQTNCHTPDTMLEIGARK